MLSAKSSRPNFLRLLLLIIVCHSFFFVFTAVGSEDSPDDEILENISLLAEVLARIEQEHLENPNPKEQRTERRSSFSNCHRSCFRRFGRRNSSDRNGSQRLLTSTMFDAINKLADLLSDTDNYRFSEKEESKRVAI